MKTTTTTTLLVLLVLRGVLSEHEHEKDKLALTPL